ncbi:phage exclusion lipoprotein Cor [Enterobacter hormaechei]|uniref:phage exclusion lipoprotein Cor n=1 Tax=Enterobacter hormaechei TaxID=158836 RepID=UPI003F433D9D
MKNMILCLAVAVLLSGCAGVIEKQQPVCTGTALVGGQESSVQIYGVRKQNNQTQYRAGYINECSEYRRYRWQPLRFYR